MKKEPKVLKDIKVVDLFCGIGGFHLAFKSFGAKIIFASDINEKARKVYENNFKLTPQGDITKIDEKTIPDHDILCAGFPCQAFSISGKQLGFEDTRGTLFFDVVRIAKEKKPKIIFLENVNNLVIHDNGNTLKVILNSLKSIGYNYYYDVLEASNFGIPQARKRIYIVAFREDLNVLDFKFPIPHKNKKYVRDILEKDELTKKYIINRDDIKLNKTTNPPLSNKPIRIGIVNKGGQGERIYSPNGQSITLSANGGGVGAKTGLYLVNGKIRKLSPRECARLQGFPDTYKLDENDNTSYTQLGNSVVVDVLQEIIEQFIVYLK